MTQASFPWSRSRLLKKRLRKSFAYSERSAWMGLSSLCQRCSAGVRNRVWPSVRLVVLSVVPVSPMSQTLSTLIRKRGRRFSLASVTKTAWKSVILTWMLLSQTDQRSSGTSRIDSVSLIRLASVRIQPSKKPERLTISAARSGFCGQSKIRIHLRIIHGISR